MPSSILQDWKQMERGLTEADQNKTTPIGTISAGSPWGGYVPDMDPARLSFSYSQLMWGLVARVGLKGPGETLTHHDGHTNLKSLTDPAGAGYVVGNPADPMGNASAIAAGENHIIMIGIFPRSKTNGDRTGNYNLTTIAVASGTQPSGADDEAYVYRLEPATSDWEKIDYVEVAPAPNDTSKFLEAAYPKDGQTPVQPLMDFAFMPSGATPRTGLIGLAGVGVISEPVFVFTNGIDPVMVYPVDAADTENGGYQVLTLAFGNELGQGSFRARSVEAWGDRLNFLNTYEDGIKHPRRLRRSAIATADPDSSLAGSGFIDFLEFDGDGLRVESLGNLLACYFEDGVAVIRRTENPEAPYHKQVLTEERGLYSTHALCDIGGGRNFGIFTDGWFILDSNGQFNEIGITQVDNVSKWKWKQTFYDFIVEPDRERIQCVYDQSNQFVWITLPNSAEGENEWLWIYDVRTDRLFPDERPVTYLAHTRLPESVEVTYADLSGETYADQAGKSYASYGAGFGGLGTIVHGTKVGTVMAHDPTITTKTDITSGDEVQPSYLYASPLSSMGSIRSNKCIQEVIMEHVRVGNPTCSFTLKNGSGNTIESNTIDLTTEPVGDKTIVHQHFRAAAERLQLIVAGTGPIAISAIDADVLDYDVRLRRS